MKKDEIKNVKPLLQQHTVMAREGKRKTTMFRRLGFVIVWLLLLFPSYLLMVFVLIVGHIGAILIWVATGKDLDDMSDKVFYVMYWFINIPYRLFGYY